MNKKYVFIPAIMLAAACGQQKGNPVNSAGKDTTIIDSNKNFIAKAEDTTAQIIPGKRIGHITIGEPMENLITVLGKPDSSDAGMGAEQFTWFSNNHQSGYRTDVYGHANFNGKDDNVRPVKLISVSSPLFKTGEGLGAGTDYHAIKSRYTTKHVASYTNKATKIVDDVAAGIAFEVDKNDICVAVLVHEPGDSAASRIALKPGLEAVNRR